MSLTDRAYTPKTSTVGAAVSINYTEHLTGVHYERISYKTRHSEF